MRKKKVDHIIDVGDDIIFIKRHTPKTMHQARTLVREALDGTLGFCYPQIRKGYDMIGQRIQREIHAQQDIKMNHHCNETVYRITEIIDSLRAKLKRYEVYDIEARRKLYNNHNRLKTALDILVDGNEIRCYTLLPSKGTLKVTWIDAPHELQMPTKIIENPFAWCKVEPMEMSEAQKHFIYYIQGVSFCGHVTKGEVISRVKDKKRKLDKTQVKRIRRGLSVNEKVISNIGINGTKFGEAVKYGKRMSNGVLEKPSDSTRKVAIKPRFEEFKGFTKQEIE